VLASGKEERAKKKASDPDAAAALDQASLGRLAKLLRPEAPKLAAAVATLGITTGISLLFPYAIGRVLDVALLPADSLLSPAAISGGLLALFCVQSGLIVLRSALLTVAGERLSAGIRRDLFKAVLSQDCAWFDKQRTGDIINRLSSDTSSLQNALTVQVAAGLRSLFMVAGGTGMLLYLSPQLAALSMVLIPPVALAGMTYGRYVQGQSKAVQAALGRTMEVAEELVSSIRTVRQHARERQEGARFDVAVGDSYRLARRIGIVAAWFDGAVHLAANVGLIAVLWYGGNQISSGVMSAGDLTAFLMYSLYMGFNLANLSR
jgi:ABC-type multidrug transport system fused ATPase/permease subunit